MPLPILHSTECTRSSSSILAFVLVQYKPPIILCRLYSHILLLRVKVNSYFHATRGTQYVALKMAREVVIFGACFVQV